MTDVIERRAECRFMDSKDAETAAASTLAIWIYDSALEIRKKKDLSCSGLFHHAILFCYGSGVPASTNCLESASSRGFTSSGTASHLRPSASVN